MTFVTYVLKCIVDPNASLMEWLIGLGVIVIIAGIWFAFLFLIDKKTSFASYKTNFIIATIITVLVVGIVIALAIVIELLVKL